MARTPPDGVHEAAGSPVDLDGFTAETPTKVRGRPRVVESPAATLSVWLPSTAYDRLALLAQRRGQSVSAYVREVLLILTSSRPG